MYWSVVVVLLGMLGIGLLPNIVQITVPPMP